MNRGGGDFNLEGEKDKMEDKGSGKEGGNTRKKGKNWAGRIMDIGDVVEMG